MGAPPRVLSMRWAPNGAQWARPLQLMMVFLTTRYFSEELRGNHVMAHVASPERRSETVRVDAEAESDEVVTETGGSEEREPTRLEWFPVALSRATAPWAQALSEPLRSVAAPLVIWVTSISLADLVSI